MSNKLLNANELKVNDLRSELAKRGLKITGKKPTLVRRLESALQDETECDSVSDSVSTTIERGGDDGDSNGSISLKSVNKFQDMGVRQLREEASRLGFSINGTKKELLDRLSFAPSEDSSDSIEAKEDEVVEKREKVVTGINQSTDTVNNLVSEKREREDENMDSNGPDKIKAVDKFQEMGVRQLRQKAACLGLSTGGSKKELLERLSSAASASRNNPSDSPEAKEDKVTGKRELIVAATKQSTDLANDSFSKKRERGDEDADLNGSHKTKAVDKYREMGVRQLRELATRLGLSTSGSKKELLERLCSTSPSNSDDANEAKDDKIAEKRQRIVTANKQSADPADHLVSMTKDQGYETGDANGSQKINAVDKFREMGIQQLRVEAARLGISTVGSKKEVLERLCSASPDNHTDVIEGKKEVLVEKKEKMITATKKGAAVLDQWLPDHIKIQFHVLQQGDEIYDAMLNQTNVGDNNNKFYVIQVLESDDGGRFMVYFRWGRVGVKGQDQLQGPYTSRDSAIQEFEQKFLAKTKNHWSNRNDFISYAKSYTWLEMDYTDKVEELTAQGTKVSSMGGKIRETKLESRIAKFISLICNVSMMKQQMMEIGYNAEKLPLGKLSKSTILKGYDVLKRIADVIGKSNRKNLEQLSGEFYTAIPHDFGFKKMREFVIDTPQKLKTKLEMVEALSEIEVATKLLTDDIQMQEDPMYSHYQRLRCELMPLEPDSEEFSMIATYTKNTHAKTHTNYSVDIVQILRVSREDEIERFKKFSNSKNRMLLWHGSRLTNWTGILSQGLRIAPPEAPVTGYMFGKGVYFADMFSKSANYCFSSPSCSAGVLLLCEVTLGDMVELLTAKYDADKLPEGKLSTKGVGATAPDLSEAQVLEDGIVVPLGKPKEQQSSKGALLYNEYIVYNVDQIRMRYIVQVNFNYSR